MKGVWEIIKSIFAFIQGVGATAVGLLAIFIIFLAAIMVSGKGEERPKVPEGAVLVMEPVGAIVEQIEYPDPLEAALASEFSQRPPQTSLHDITRALKKAKNDDRIAALALITDYLGPIGPSHMHTIAAAIRDFKASGKKVYALSTAYSQAGYLLAAEADKVYMNPMGSVLLTGYANYPTYFKSLLDKLEANVNVFRVGTYKSAVEPFIRDDMSPAAKEANIAFLGGLWDQYETSVETARGLEAGALGKDIEDLPELLRNAEGNFAKLALSGGLVDELAPRKVWRQALREEYGPSDGGNSFKQIHYETYLAALGHDKPSRNEIAVITAQGQIVMGEGPITITAAETVVGYIRQARNNPDTAAIVLRVNSPGGSAFASELIRQELVAAQEQGLKVIASMGPVAASGGYWISATADEIWAAPSTITGSIGIFGVIPTFENTLAKVGIHTDGVGTTPMAGAFNTARPLSDMTKDVIQQSIEAGYGEFLSLVAEGRNMTVEDVDKIAQGRVWVGTKAKELGLVDHLGGFDDAVAAAAAAAEVENYTVAFYRDYPSNFDQMIADLLNSSVGGLFKSEAPKLPSSMMQFAAKLKTDAELLLNFNDPLGSYAVCFVCQLDQP
ncbi:MAG: signal peptide peptidase SppA [Alphaproteobacteria bacterium]|nr:signal peptide peptidase SppA [Alphaproteobacteria bacterium]